MQPVLLNGVSRPRSFVDPALLCGNFMYFSIARVSALTIVENLLIELFYWTRLHIHHVTRECYMLFRRFVSCLILKLDIG